MAKTKQKKQAKQAPSERTARRPTMTVTVSSPWLPGVTDRVEKVVDTIMLMRRSKQINEWQYLAADRFRDAYEAVRTGLGGACDLERVRAGGGQGRGSNERAAWGTETLADATACLAKIGGSVIVEMVVGQGYSVDDAAGSLFGRAADGTVRRQDREAVGNFLRMHLRALADLWGIGPRTNRKSA